MPSTYSVIAKLEQLIEEAVPLFLSLRNLRRYLRVNRHRLTRRAIERIECNYFMVEWDRMYHRNLCRDIAMYIYCRLPESAKMAIDGLGDFNPSGSFRRRLNAMLMLNVAMYFSNRDFGNHIYRLIAPHFQYQWYQYRFNLRMIMNLDCFSYTPDDESIALGVLQEMNSYGVPLEETDL